MSQAEKFLRVAESVYPHDVFFTGGNMPEEVDDDDYGICASPDTVKNDVDAKKKEREKDKKEDRSGLYSQPQARHFISLFEELWSGDVDTKKHPPEGKFTQGAEAIAKWLKSSHKSLKSAVAALNFYHNRNPKNMSKDKHDQILGMLHTAFGES